MSGKCSGLHCPGCGDGGGAGLIIAVIIGLVVIGSGAAARAADRLLSMVETILIIAGISLGSAAVLIIGGVAGYRSISRARAHARASIPAAQPARATVTLRVRPELPPGGSRTTEELHRAVWTAPADALPADRIRK